MPNHIVTVLKIKADPIQVLGVREYLNGENGIVDFNKVIPRPLELDVTSDGLVMYLDNSFTRSRPVKELADEIRKAPRETVENFCKALLNINAHGYASWYDWSLAKWGTKWNAYDQEEIEENTIKFETAWSCPKPVLHALSKRFPSVTFEIEFADEDYGSNLGHVALKDGLEWTLTYFDSETGKAFAYRLHGVDPSEFEEES